MTSSPPASLLSAPASANKKWAALLLGLAVLGLFSKVLSTPGLLLSTPDGDLASQFLGWRAWGFSEWRKGHLALWNPYIFCGAPFFAGAQSALLYPLNILFLFVPILLALNLSIALHVWLAGFFTYLWLASRRLYFLPALLGAFAFMFGGAFIAHVYPGHLSNLCAMAWIPLVLWALERLARAPDLTSSLALAGVLSLQILAGHPQYFAYTLLLGLLYFSILVAGEPTEWKPKILGATAGAALAALLTIVQWLPGLLASRDFHRDLDPGTLGFFSTDWASLRAFLYLDPRTSPVFHPGVIDSRIWWENCPFLGVGVIFWVLLGLTDDRRTGKAKWAPFGLAVLAVLLALGPHTPLDGLLRLVPPFGDFRGSSKFLVLSQVFLALLAAQGAQGFLEAGTSPLARTLRFLRNPWGLSILLAVSFIPLFDLARLCSPSFDAEKWGAEGERAAETWKGKLGDGRIYMKGNNDRSMLLGAPSIWGDDPLVPRRLERLLAAGAPKPRTADGTLLNLDAHKMAVTRLAYWVEEGPDGLQARALHSPWLPRFLLVGAYLKVKDLDEGIQALGQPAFHPVSQVVLEEDPDPAPLENGGRGQVSVRIQDPDRMEFSLKLDKPQILLMTDSYAPGWEARAFPDSGQRSYRVLPADVFARAIPLSAGSHHFELAYAPPGFDLGKWLSLLGLLLYGAAWVRVFRLK
ncbi:MAG TPA: hypothetical protein VHE12_00100 [bacterium]|nr:hypothetical protein [bacterium]